MPLYSFNNVTRLFSSTTSTATTGLVEETLLSYTLKANQLAVNGQGVRITASGTFVANANAKTVKVYFGSTVLQTMTGNPSGGGWSADCWVLRATATTQVGGGLGLGLNGSLIGSQTTAPAETLSGTVLIKVTGTGPTTIGDIVQTALLIELF